MDLQEKAQDEIFVDIQDLSLSELADKYGGIEEVDKSHMDDVETEETEVEAEEIEEGELPEVNPFDPFDDEGVFDESEEIVDVIDDGYDLESAIIHAPDSLSAQVDTVKSFEEAGLGFLGPGVVASINGVHYQLAVRVMNIGNLAQEPIDVGRSFESDLRLYLTGEPIDGLTTVQPLNVTDDAAMCCGVSFIIDDGSEFRVYILGTESEWHGQMVRMSLYMDDPDLLVTKADSKCMQNIWKEYYKYYSGKYISAAMQAWSSSNWAKAAAAFEKARDGFEPKKNKAEYSCLEEWRAEAASKAGGEGKK